MSVLTLVRHGQASFFSADYDQLTPLGEQQVRLLGEYWARRGTTFDEVYTGPRVRQKRSAELTGAAYRHAGLAWPDPTVVDDLDEYDYSGMLRRLAPELARGDAEFAHLADVYRRSDEGERMRTFQKMFEALLHHWQAAPHDGGPVESWPAFRERVRRAIRRVQELPGQGRRVAV